MSIYRIYNDVAKQFQFPSIQENSPQKAQNKLFKLIGKDAYKWRFQIKRIPGTEDIIHDELDRRLAVNNRKKLFKPLRMLKYKDDKTYVVEYVSKRGDMICHDLYNKNIKLVIALTDRAYHRLGSLRSIEA